MDSDSSSSETKKTCWVCFGTELDDEDTKDDVLWIHPCKCRGSMKWVHESCLQRWIDEKQKRIHTTLVSCSHCKTNYILSFPPVNCIIRLIDRYDKFLFKSSPLVGIVAVLGSVYWCFRSHGKMSVIQIMGYEEGSRLIDEADPLLHLIGLPAIPIILILSKMIKWEDYILKIWKQRLFKTPSFLTSIIEQPPVNPRANCDQILIEPGFNDPTVCTRLVCGALLLPSVSALVGKLFFDFLTGSHWRKPILGGLSFLLIKGALKIYLRKSLYIRYSQRSIRNYKTRASTDEPMEGSSSSNIFTDDLNHSSDNGHDTGDEIDDFEGYERNLFTMRIGY